jgi:putative DNA primase/helicase
MTNATFEGWVAQARAVPIEQIIEQRGLKLRGGVDRSGPCPVCGGEDRFAINVKKQLFNCRQCAVGGDVIKLVEHLDRVDFIHACETLTGEPPPKTNGHANYHGLKNVKPRSKPEQKANGQDTNDAQEIVVAEFQYQDSDGNLAFVVERREYRKADGSFVLGKKGKRKKTFRQKRPDPHRAGRWIWSVDSAPVVPYRLPGVIEAIASDHQIVIAEGEGKIDLLWSWNVPATCCAMGSGKWRDEHSHFLRGADVVILPDNDSAGRKHVDKVAASLQGIAASVRVLELPSLPDSGDILDWAASGGTVEMLHCLMESEAKPWTAAEEKTEETAEPLLAPEHSDDALALQFAEQHEDNLRYVDMRARWMVWKACRWQADETLRAFDCARTICRRHAAQCDNPRVAAQLTSAKTIAAVERLAKADRRIAATTGQFDAEPEAFNERGDAL